jgi:hypothetical protein
MNTKLSRRTLVVATAAAATLPAATLAKANHGLLPAPDPIFAAIERHRAAMAVQEFEDDEACSLACEAEWEAREDFLLTEPTTIAGIAAVLDYVNSPDVNTGSQTILHGAWENPDMSDLAESFLPTIAATLRRLTV